MLRVALCTALLPFAAAATAPKPNIILAALDDLGWTDVGYHGSDFPTPVIDGLAKGGVRLENYYVQQVCSPTRSALMTARYPFRTGMQHKTTLAPQTLAKLPLDRRTIAETLRNSGYRTHMIGKWHLGYASWNYTPTGRGFDTYVGYMQGQCDYYTRVMELCPFGEGKMCVDKGFDFWKNRTAAWEVVGTYSMGDYLAEMHRVFDAHDPATPFFLYFAHQDIHIPLEAPPEKKYDDACSVVSVDGPDGKNRRTLCTMANRLDDALGEMVDALKAKAMWDNTLLWVTTDNGGMTQFTPTFPGSASSNYPLRGGKTTVFQGGVRGVSFVSGGFIPSSAAGTSVTGLLQHVDIPATLAAVAGADWAGDVDGLNVWGTIARGEPSPRREVPINVDVSAGGHDTSKDFSSIIVGDLKLINGAHGAYDGWWSNDPYTHTDATAAEGSVTAANGAPVYLFNITADPTEHTNLAATRPDDVKMLQARLASYSDPTTGYLDPQPNKPTPEGAARRHNHTWAPWL